MARIIKEVPVWITEYGSPEQLKGDDYSVIAATFLHMPYPHGDGSGPDGWTRVGTAKVEFEFADEKELISNKVDSLNAQLQKERADSQVRQNAILDKISKLQALEYVA